MSRVLLFSMLAASVALAVVRLRLAWRLRGAVAGVPWDEIRRVARRAGEER